MDFLSEFEFNIKHIEDKEHKLEDYSIRHPHAIMEISVSSNREDFMEQIKNSIQEIITTWNFTKSYIEYIFQGMLKIKKSY